MREVLITKNPSSKIDVYENDQGEIVLLKGHWLIHTLADSIPSISQELLSLSETKVISWDLNEIEALDSAGALLIWRSWGKKFPQHVSIRPEHLKLFERWRDSDLAMKEPKSDSFKLLVIYFSSMLQQFYIQFLHWVEMLGQLVLDSYYLLTHPSEIPFAEISISIFEAGVRALGITALVGFLIGIVLSYLSALQLHAFGAEIYIVDILGISIIRELGPLLAAILVAGRSGSSMTAQIGIMRVTEELDALSAMGISHSQRLIFPKVIALMIVLPLITVWTDVAALVGGMLSAKHTLDISAELFFLRLPDTIPLVNVFIGVGKAAVFGILVALIACHFGFLIKPNTESLGNETTNSVVASITAVIMADAVFAILFMHVGMP